MPNFDSISFKMAVLQGAGRICPSHVLVIQKTPCGIGLTFKFCSIGMINGANLKLFFVIDPKLIFPKKFHSSLLVSRGFQNRRKDIGPSNFLRRYHIVNFNLFDHGYDSLSKMKYFSHDQNAIFSYKAT